MSHCNTADIVAKSWAYSSAKHLAYSGVPKLSAEWQHLPKSYAVSLKSA